MQYRFDDFTLDLDLGELLRGGEAIAVEPRAFAMLCYLVENSDRLIGKDELVEKLWDGRIVSDAAISTVLKTARKALGDSGSEQRYIRTVHGRGFRFVATRTVRATAQVRDTEEPVTPAATGETGQRPTVAVLPFTLIGGSESYSAIADAIPSELIASLSRLRWLKVIARGSSFRFRETERDFAAIGEALGAKYLLTGDVELFDGDLAITVELAECSTGHVIWGDRLSGSIDDVHGIREEIVILVTSALELHVPQHEAQMARLLSPESLDAWSCYHLGLQHMYRFNRADNDLAAGHFARATELDPLFARAHAARSFTSFQSAFLRYGSDRAADIENARRHAERSVSLDPMDPFGNFNFGRAHWLRGDPAAGQAWLERSLSLSPSFAQGFYAHGWADIMAGEGAAALANLSRAITLSPLDPFLYAMKSTTGLAQLHLGDLEEAARWSSQGARTPGAHYLICAVAAAINEIAGKPMEARYWAEQSFARRKDASIEAFFAAFPFRDEKIRSDLRRALTALGFRH